jgi:hypothetical protein
MIYYNCGKLMQFKDDFFDGIGTDGGYNNAIVIILCFGYG